MNNRINRIKGLLCVGAAAMLSSCGGVFSQQLAADMQPSYIAVETNNERVLFSQNANERRPIGMLANVATAMVVMDWMKAANVSMDTMMTVPQAACRWPSSNLLQLRPGDRISLRDALHSTLMWDDSAAATALAWACGYRLNQQDPEGAFLVQLNKLAETIGMKQTMFKGVSGAVRSTSTARDLVLLGIYAVERPQVQTICSKHSYTATIVSGGVARNVTIVNTNRMLGQSGVDGVRAAGSPTAGYCLMASAKRGSVKAYNPTLGKQSTYAQRLLVVVLGMHSDSERNAKTAALLRDGWEAWEIWQSTSDSTDKSKFIRLPKH